ncbi:hypothetical protein JCM10908_000252 [Rhodotorula pacifica]|uniref:uncharacterized protein n=1 Tax=Rhodotorula pacifica TaxID=1495444 RepID=UPI00316EE7C6
MTLMDQTQGSDMERLWALLSELSAQLSHNRQQTEELHRRADELKAQAVHAQTGFTLRRFNLDVSQEEFESELERLNVQLVTENQALQQENRQLSSLLKDYESTLEAVMGKFRAHAHATQQHHLDLTRHYESLLLSMPVSIPPPADLPPDPSNPEAPPIDPEHLQLSLSHLASLIRKALRAMQGEDPEDSTSPLLLPMGIGEATSALSDVLRKGSRARDSQSNYDDEAGPPSPTSSIRSFSSIASSAAAAPPSATGSETESDLDRLLASHHPSTSRSRALESEGGYVSRLATTDPHYVPTTSASSLVMTPPRPGQARVVEDEMASRGLGPLDEALQRDVEIEALRRENEELKKLLRISEMELDDERDSRAAAMTAATATGAPSGDPPAPLAATTLTATVTEADRDLPKLSLPEKEVDTEQATDTAGMDDAAATAADSQKKDEDGEPAHE